MRLTGGQNIPSILHKKYTAVAGVERYLRGKWYIEARPAFRNLPQQGGKIKGLGITDYNSGVTFAQKVVRSYFRDAVHCFKQQPAGNSGTWGIPGPIGREKWFWAGYAAGMWYYDWFMKQTLLKYNAGEVPMWCIGEVETTYSAAENSPDEPHIIHDVAWAVQSIRGNGTRIHLHRPPVMRYLNIFLYQFTYNDSMIEENADIKFCYCDDDWPEYGPTWNNYEREGICFDNIVQETYGGAADRQLKIDCDGYKNIIIRCDGPSVDEDNDLGAGFSIFEWPEWPAPAAYWSAT